MSDQERLAEVKARLERVRTTRPGNKAPTSESEALAYLLRLGRFLEQLLPDIDWLVGEVERLRELLGRLEWAGSTQAYQQAFCPVCQRSKLGGHGRACWLAAELRP